jgi:hypothetical protein
MDREKDLGLFVSGDSDFVRTAAKKALVPEEHPASSLGT